MAVEVTREGAVAVVTVNRPEALNSLNSETNEALLAAVRQLSPDESVHAVVLTGGGEKSFVAGADIAEMSALTAEQARRFGALGQAVMSGIEAAPQPWVAAVNGFALGGGCELALACDIRLAEELAGKSPLAMRYCKAAVNAATGTDIVTGQGIERDLFALAFATEDQTEGMAAFLEKRAPEFGGR
jgi:enoyl-CoA hydratase/carnithine racemase